MQTEWPQHVFISHCMYVRTCMQPDTLAHGCIMHALRIHMFIQLALYVRISRQLSQGTNTLCVVTLTCPAWKFAVQRCTESTEFIDMYMHVDSLQSQALTSFHHSTNAYTEVLARVIHEGVVHACIVNDGACSSLSARDELMTGVHAIQFTTLHVVQYVVAAYRLSELSIDPFIQGNWKFVYVRSRKMTILPECLPTHLIHTYIRMYLRI